MSKMFNYEADQIHDMVHPDLLTNTTHYVAECKEIILNEVTPNYPKLTEYEKEWMYFSEHVYQDGHPVNLEYQTVDIDGYATVENAIPFYYKSAILKGNTIVSHYSSDIIELTANGSWIENPVSLTQITLPVKPSTDYLFVVEIIENSLIGDETINNSLRFGETEGTGRFPTVFKSISTIPLHQLGMYRFILTTKADISNIDIFDRKQLSKHCTGGKIKFRYVVIEYQQRMENWDIPYFGGMKSVQMPVLKAIGKNLLKPMESSKTENGIVWTLNRDNTVSAIGTPNATTLFNYFKGKLPVGTYTLSGGCSKYSRIQINNEDSSFFKATSEGLNYNELTFVITEELSQQELRIDVRCGNGEQVDFTFKPQLEKLSVSTEYEPFKSNILTVNEDVELRGIGEVKDELNLLTGELTQRIGEIVLDGSDDENWVKRNNGDGTNTITFQIPLDANRHDEIILDKFALSQSSSDGIEGAGYASDIKVLFIEIKRDRLNNVNVDEFKQWLSQNPITVQHTLTTESVKTVDLSKIIRPYEGTNHYTLSSETIPPHLQLSIPVESTGAQTLNEINQEE